MNKLNLVEKLRDKTDISYEEAKSALENNNWDILDAIVYLEEHGRVKKPEISVFYTNESKKGDVNQGEVLNLSKKSGKHKSKNDFNGFFETICNAIDTGNNIFLEIKRQGRLFLKIPITVVLLLLIFTFWLIIPLMLIGLFFELEYSIIAKMIDSNKIDKINDGFKEAAKVAMDIKEKIMKEINK